MPAPAALYNNSYSPGSSLLIGFRMIESSKDVLRLLMIQFGKLVNTNKGEILTQKERMA